MTTEPNVPGTCHPETAIRRAMIAAGYGEGWTINLPAERLPDYAKDTNVAAILADPDRRLTMARDAYHQAAATGKLGDWAARASVYVAGLEAERATTTVQVGVIEWGSAHDDQSPDVFVGRTEDAVRLAAYQRIADAASWADPDVDVDTFPATDETNPADVVRWLDAWREQTTAAWLTVTEAEVLS